MSNKLEIFIISLAIIFIIYICLLIKKRLLSTKHSLIWILISLGLILSTIFNNQMLKIFKMIGVLTFSNMIFFLGFIVLIFICLNLSKYISKLNREIIKLTQEVGIIEYELKKK